MVGEFVLIVEDEEDIAELLEYTISRQGYVVDSVGTGEKGLQICQETNPDLLILDLMLPKLSGLEVCRKLKTDTKTAGIPIIILTAKGEEEDIIAGFEAGADDYVTKPFRPKVLLARIKALLGRGAASRTTNADELAFENIKIHLGRHEIYVSDTKINLTNTEFNILHFLALRPGWVFTRRQIVKAVHGEDYPVTGRSIDVQVAALRRKLGDAGDHISTVRGVGYKMGE